MSKLWYVVMVNCSVVVAYVCFFFFQAEDGIRDLVRSRGLGDVYKRQRQSILLAYGRVDDQLDSQAEV